MPCLNLKQVARARARGVTLIEMIIVIAITGIIAAAVAVFISRPIEGYVDAARRAELTDIADTALRRMTRDLRTALPNSIRFIESPPGTFYLEYLQSSGGGRYRAEVDSGGAGNILNFTDPLGDSSFDVIGAMPTFAGGESIVIYNLAASGTTANAYGGDNRELVNVGASTATTVTLNAAKQFPFPSPGKRFQVAQYAVTYVCNPVTRDLRRYWDYGILAAQPTPPVTANNALLASDIAVVDGCRITYEATGQRTGVVTLSLRIERSGESIQLFQQVHVNNAP